MLNWKIINTKRISIRCKNKEETIKFLQECEEQNINWATGLKATKALTCYRVISTNEGEYLTETSELMTPDTIINFEDVQITNDPNTLQVPTKFQLGQKVYIIKQIKPKKICPICKGKKKIKYNNKDMTCPECKGFGIIISNKIINIVDDRKFTVKVIKTATYEDGFFIVKYKINSDFDILNRAEENLFATRKEAQARCNELNDSRIDVKVSNIKISNDFKNSRPSTGKILKKLDYYNRYGKFNTDITLDKDNILIDGYINYLICQLLHIETVKVTIKDDKN